MPAGPPPPDRQCTEIVTGHRADTGYRCPQWAMAGETVCRSHSPQRSHLTAPPDDRRCTARAKNGEGKGGNRCSLWAMKGLTVCYRHGGATKAARKAGERRVTEQEVERRARQLLASKGASPVENPLRALSQAAGEVLAFKDALGDMVNNLEEIRYKGGAGEQIRAEVVLYERALDRAGTFLANIARLNIDERLAAIDEKQAEAVVRAIEAALAYAGVTGDNAVEAKKVAARHLRAVT